MSDEEMEEYGGGGAEEEVDDIDEVRVRIQPLARQAAAADEARELAVLKRVCTWCAGSGCRHWDG